MPHVSWQEVLAAVTLCGVAITAARRLRRSWQGLRGRWTALTEQMEAVAQDVQRIRSEVTVNGGTSLRDAVSRVECELAMEREARRWTSGAPANYDVRVRDGFLTEAHVSAAYMTLTGLASSDVADNGWLRCVHPDDRERVRALALSAIEEEDVFVTSYRVRHVTSANETLVEHMARPVRVRRNAPVIGWVGCLIQQPAGSPIP